MVDPVNDNCDTSSVDNLIITAAKSEERKTRDREMRDIVLVVMFVAYCLSDEQRPAAEKLLRKETLNHTERGWMVREKLVILKSTLDGVDQQDMITAKYLLCYCLHSGLFKWTDGGALYRLIGRRTAEAMRSKNEPRIRRLVDNMIDEIKQLEPPRNLYTTRLAIPGRTCHEVAQVLGNVLREHEVDRILATVSKAKSKLSECWNFWRGEREQEEVA